MRKEFERFEKLIGTESLLNLSRKTVCIVGLGGVGGYVLEALARSGITSFVLVDFDIVDRTNINRQIIALQSTIGQKKIEAWKKRLLDINPEIRVIAYDFFYQDTYEATLFQNKIDFLVDACDSIPAKENLIQACLTRKIPFISSMGTGKRLDPSKLYITDLTKTSYDPIARILRKWAKDQGIKAKIPVLTSTEIPRKSEGTTVSSCAFVPSSAGLLIASYVVSQLQKK